MYVQIYCFAYKTLWFFWRSRCRPRHWILKSRNNISSHRNLWFAPCKGIRIPEFGKFFLWNPGNFSCGIRNPGFWNPEYRSRNAESPLWLESGIHSTDKESRIQYLEFRIHGVKSRIQDCLRNPRVRLWSFGMIRIRIRDPRSLGPC